MSRTNGPLFDEDAGRRVRPYSVTNGRTSPSVELDMLSMVYATGHVPVTMAPEHAHVLGCCTTPTSVVEVGAYIHQPLVVAKVLLSDLIHWEALAIAATAPTAPDLHKLTRLLDALHKLPI